MVVFSTEGEKSQVAEEARRLLRPGTVRMETSHGKVAPTLERGLDNAQRIFEQLARVGVDYDDVTTTLEKEGIQKFTDSFEELLTAIEAKRRDLIPA